MLKTNLEFKKGILFIRLEGNLNKKTIEQFDNEVLAVVLSNKLKYVVVNLDQIYEIDEKGVDGLMELNDIVYNFNGITTLCNLTNRNVKKIIKENDFTNNFYEVANELTALKVMNL